MSLLWLIFDFGSDLDLCRFFIRIMLLSGSRFKRQLIPDTYTIFPLAILSVIFSVGMQFILAWYLCTRLPQSINCDNAILRPYPATDSEGGLGYFESPHAFARAPLPAYLYPNYSFANGICRTAPIVQLVCIGLNLFSILNNVPGIRVMKNFAIRVIWASERFVSEDEDGVTKLDYWRQSDYSREPEIRRRTASSCASATSTSATSPSSGSAQLEEPVGHLRLHLRDVL
jgi:hypothetical protein